MLDDMSDGMINLVEEKVAATLAAQSKNRQNSDHTVPQVGGLLAERCKKVGLPVDIKGWLPVSLEVPLPKVCQQVFFASKMPARKSNNSGAGKVGKGLQQFQIPLRVCGKTIDLSRER